MPVSILDSIDWERIGRRTDDPIHQCGVAKVSRQEPDREKWDVCAHFKKFGVCPYEERCTFSHHPWTLWNYESDWKRFSKAWLREECVLWLLCHTHAPVYDKAATAKFRRRVMEALWREDNNHGAVRIKELVMKHVRWETGSPPSEASTSSAGATPESSPTLAASMRPTRLVRSREARSPRAEGPEPHSHAPSHRLQAPTLGSRGPKTYSQAPNAWFQAPTAGAGVPKTGSEAPSQRPQARTSAVRVPNTPSPAPSLLPQVSDAGALDARSQSPNPWFPTPTSGSGVPNIGSQALKQQPHAPQAPPPRCRATNATSSDRVRQVQTSVVSAAPDVLPDSLQSPNRMAKTGDVDLCQGLAREDCSRCPSGGAVPSEASPCVEDGASAPRPTHTTACASERSSVAPWAMSDPNVPVSILDSIDWERIGRRTDDPIHQCGVAKVSRQEPDREKWDVCAHFKKFGVCPYEERCTFSHHPWTLWNYESDWKRFSKAWLREECVLWLLCHTHAPVYDKAATAKFRRRVMEALWREDNNHGAVQIKELVMKHVRWETGSPSSEALTSPAPPAVPLPQRPVARCHLAGALALLVDTHTGQEFKVPEGHLRRNALSNCLVHYRPKPDYDKPKPDRILEDEEEEECDLGTIPLDVLWSRNAAEVVEVDEWPEDKLTAFVSNSNYEKRSEECILLAGSNNTHLYFMVADDPELARSIREFLEDDLVEYRLDSKIRKFWVKVRDPQPPPPQQLPEAYVCVTVISEVELSGSCEDAITKHKAAAKDLAQPYTAAADRDQDRGAECPLEPIDCDWLAVDTEGTASAEQLFSLSPQIRYAVATPIPVLAGAGAAEVGERLRRLMAQAESLFLGDEKVSLLGDDLERRTCFARARGPAAEDGDGDDRGRVAIVMTFGRKPTCALGRIAGHRIRFLTVSEVEAELQSAGAPLAQQVQALEERLPLDHALPFDEGEAEFALEFRSREAPHVALAQPLRRTQALLQRIRLSAERLVGCELRRARQPGLVRAVRPPLRCHLDTFYQAPYNDVIRDILHRGGRAVGPRFTVQDLVVLRQRLRETDCGTDNSVKVLRDVHLKELLRLCESEVRLLDPEDPAWDFLRGVRDSAPVDKACRSVVSLINQVLLLAVVPNAFSGTARRWCEALREFLTAEGVRNLQRRVRQVRGACRDLRLLQFHTGMLSQPLECDMYVVGLFASRVKLKCALTGVSLSAEVLQPYCKGAVYEWTGRKGESAVSSVALHFLDRDEPLVLQLWDVLPVWLLGVAENGEMGLRVVALCTDRTQRRRASGWLPVCSSRTASTWGDLGCYRLRENAYRYDTVDALLRVQFPAFQHAVVCNALQCSAPLKQDPDPARVARSDGDEVRGHHRGACQQPLRLRLKGSQGADFHFELPDSSSSQPRHPCEAYRHQCMYRPCVWRYFPRNACLEVLKGKRATCQCKRRHLSEAEAEGYRQETRSKDWLDYSLARDGFIGVFWFVADVRGTPSPFLWYVFLEKLDAPDRDRGLHLRALRVVTREMPHNRRARALWQGPAPPREAHALLFPVPPAQWVTLKKLCPDAHKPRPPVALLGQCRDEPLRSALPALPTPGAAVHALLDQFPAPSPDRQALQRQHPQMFALFTEQALFIRAVISPRAPGRLPLLLGPAGTGKTTTLLYTTWFHHRIHPKGLVLFLAPSNLPVDAMYRRACDAFGRDLRPVRVMSRTEQQSRAPHAAADAALYPTNVPPDCDAALLCMTVDKFLQSAGAGRWPPRLRIGLLLIDEVQGVPDAVLLVALHYAQQHGTADVRTVAAGDPSQLKGSVTHELQRSLQVDFSRRAMLLWARQRELDVFCLSQIARFTDPVLLDLASVVYSRSTFPMALRCVAAPPSRDRPRKLPPLRALQVAGREQRLPVELLTLRPGISPHTLYNAGQCDAALELCQSVWRAEPEWEVLLLSVYEGDRTYLEQRVRTGVPPGQRVKVEVVDRVGGQQADVVICVTTRTCKHFNGRPCGSVFWSANRVVTACTRHRQAFVLLACPEWIQSCWANGLRDVWDFMWKSNPTSLDVLGL